MEGMTMHTPNKIRPFVMLLALVLLAACNQPAPTAELTVVAVASNTPLPTEPPLITPTTGELPTATLQGTELPTNVPPPTNVPTVVTSATATPSPVATTAVPAQTATITPTVNLTPSRTPIVEDNRFAIGAHVFGFAHFAQMQQAGMTWLKLQVRWDGTSPASAVQSQINSARGGGFKVLLSVVGDKAQLAADRAAYIQKYSD